MKNGEDSILALIGKYFPNSHETFYMGRGDDCALIQVPHNLLAITSDVFAQNAHFRTHYFSPYEIGYKSLAVNISDLASNGALPRSFSLNLTLTDKEDMAWLEAFFHGMSDLANKHSMGLLGGDLAKVPTYCPENTEKKDWQTYNKQSGLNIGITAFGDYSHGGIPLLRNSRFIPPQRSNHNATYQETITKNSLENEDILFLIGDIGLARTGLFLLEEARNQEEIKKIHTHFPLACEAHLKPKPLVKEGLFLSQFAHKHPIFCMDISDGLKRDIPRLLAQEGIFSFSQNTNSTTSKTIVSKTITPKTTALRTTVQSLNAKISLQESELSKEVIQYSREKKLDPIPFAYAGGEDYGLLGACSKDAWQELYPAWQKNNFLKKIQKIGEIFTQEKNLHDAHILLNGERVSGEGFDHFSK